MRALYTLKKNTGMTDLLRSENILSVSQLWTLQYSEWLHKIKNVSRVPDYIFEMLRSRERTGNQCNLRSTTRIPQSYYRWFDSKFQAHHDFRRLFRFRVKAFIFSVSVYATAYYRELQSFPYKLFLVLLVLSFLVERNSLSAFQLPLRSYLYGFCASKDLTWLWWCHIEHLGKMSARESWRHLDYRALRADDHSFLSSSLWTQLDIVLWSSSLSFAGNYVSQ